MALCAGSAALGQSLKPYRLHVLKDSGGADFVVNNLTPVIPPIGGNAISINDRGVIGGFFRPDPSQSKFRGFVWFPNDLDLVSPAHAFPQRRVLDIHSHGVSLAAGHSSFVNDVADIRALVGFMGDFAAGTGEAHVFPLQLAAPASIGAVSLHTTSGDFSTAFGAKDSTPIEIVGETTLTCNETSQYHRPFKTTWSPGGGAGTMSLLGLPATADSGRATDVARTGTSFLASGEVEGCETDTDDCTATVCDLVCPHDYLDAVRWAGSSTKVLDGLETPDSGVGARGINPSGDVCGWGYVVVGEEECPRRAGFWRADLDAGFVPGNTMPTAPIPESWAEALTPRTTDGCVSIVGMNLDTNDGLIWHGFNNAWCVADLNDVTLPCSHDYLIRQAMDINKHRHVTVLVAGPGGTTHVGVLTSAADFGGDLRVDAVDRTELNANLCASGCTAAQLIYDLNCDGVVTSADMALLVGTYWSGPTKLAVVPTICACAVAGSFAEPLMDEATALAALGFAGWNEFCDWLATADADLADSVCDAIVALIRPLDEDPD